MSEWTKITDILPTCGFKVLIFNGGRHMAWLSREGKFICPYDHKPVENVTHWMPLPETPHV